MKKSNLTSITPSQEQQAADTVATHMYFFKKFKRLNPLEPSIGFLGFFFLAFLFIGCFFYLDYQTVTRGLPYRGVTWLGLIAPSSSSSSSAAAATATATSAAAAAAAAAADSGAEEGRVGFLEMGRESCDIFDGNWVWDDSYPLYQTQDCLFMDNGFKCLENGRPDSFYTKWRWQPKHCNLPRFDGRLMLEKLRNRRLVFAGDSIGRNQWESLLCMLSSTVPDNSSVYEINGNPITKHRGFLAFMFKDYNCTIEYYRAPFLMYQGHPPAGAPEEVRMTVRVDKLDWTSPQWRHADVLILNSAHWWNHEKTIRGGCYFQEGEEVKMNMTVETAYRKSIETLITWIHSKVNISKTQVFFRTYAPVHFRGGDWKTGGSCHLEKLPDLGSLPYSSEYRYKIMVDVLTNFNDSLAMNLDLLNVTKMSSRRKDGHTSVYYLEPNVGPAPLHRQDCSHWCLPGVPDSWNELLYALFMKRQNLQTHSTESTQTQL